MSGHWLFKHDLFDQEMLFLCSIALLNFLIKCPIVNAKIENNRYWWSLFTIVEITWMKYFFEIQNFKIKKKIIIQNFLQGTMSSKTMRE